MLHKKVQTVDENDISQILLDERLKSACLPATQSLLKTIKFHFRKKHPNIFDYLKKKAILKGEELNIYIFSV